MVGKAKRPRTTSIEEPYKLDARGKEILEMISVLEDERRLNKWEMGFIVDISDKFLGKNKDLTQGQYDKLKELYNKYNN